MLRSVSSDEIVCRGTKSDDFFSFRASLGRTKKVSRVTTSNVEDLAVKILNFKSTG